MPDKYPEDWEGSRPPAHLRWLAPDQGPVRFEVRTCWHYSGDVEVSGRGGPHVMTAVNPETGLARHAFSRAGSITRTDVPSPYEHQQDIVSNLWRAIEAFGDDTDLVIEVRRKGEGE